MESTTLTTFLLHVHPSVRSVKLLGSWDNFSKPYTMGRDKRVGPGHWKGCYTFANIICDGSSCNPAQGRTGGLRMGSTYWYYYLLDDYTEFYNERETVTTLCPFLPGQPVNVLHVPVVLPDSIFQRRHDKGSNASFQEPGSLDYRTMEPEDKYLNPKQPPKHGLRIKTSLPPKQQYNLFWPFNGGASPWDDVTRKSTSQPTRQTDRMTGVTDCKFARSDYTPRATRAFRTAFRRVYDHSPQNDILARKHGSRNGDTSGESTLPIRRITNNQQSDTKFLRQRPANDTPTPLSIQNREDLTPKSRNYPSLKNFLSLITPPKTGFLRRDAVVEEDLGPKPNSPTQLANVKNLVPSREQETAKPPSSKEEKRLPSLPSSPAAVMDDTTHAIDSPYNPLSAEKLHNYFPDFTPTHKTTTNNDSTYEKSHFSEWGTDTETICSDSDSTISTSTYNNDITGENQISPKSDSTFEHATLDLKPHSAYQKPDFHDFKPSRLSVPRLSLTLCSLSLDIPGISNADLELDDVGSKRRRQSARFENPWSTEKV